MQKYSNYSIAQRMIDDICSRLPKDTSYIKKGYSIQFTYTNINYELFIKNHPNFGLAWFGLDGNDTCTDHHTAKIRIFNEEFSDNIEFCWLVEYFSDRRINIDILDEDKDRYKIYFKDYKLYIIYDKFNRTLCKEDQYKHELGGVNIIQYLQDPFIDEKYMEKY